MRRVDNENAKLLRSFSEQNRQIADYLINQNKKFELLAQYIIADKNQTTSTNTTQVNLSEGGIAFAADKAIYKGSYLALRLLFIPSYISVALFAKVIRSASNSDDRHHIAAKFHRIEEPQQQILSKHIIQAQLQAKRRGNKTAGEKRS